MARLDAQAKTLWLVWLGRLYWPTALVVLGVVVGGQFWKMALPSALAKASVVALVGSTLAIVVLPALLMYAGLSWWSGRLSENESKLKNVINAGRLACLLVPILCVALALSLPVTWPVFLVVAVLPVGVMLLGALYYGFSSIMDRFRGLTVRARMSSHVEGHGIEGDAMNLRTISVGPTHPPVRPDPYLEAIRANSCDNPSEQVPSEGSNQSQAHTDADLNQALACALLNGEWHQVAPLNARKRVDATGAY